MLSGFVTGVADMHTHLLLLHISQYDACCHDDQVARCGIESLLLSCIGTCKYGSYPVAKGSVLTSISERGERSIRVLMTTADQGS